MAPYPKFTQKLPKPPPFELQILCPHGIVENLIFFPLRKIFVEGGGGIGTNVLAQV